MHVYVARHGETTWNVAGRYQGRRESALSALGVRQGLALGDAFARAEPPLRRVISSPLIRCSATASFVADRLGIAVEHDVLLLEIAHGTWEGRLRGEIALHDPERLYAWKHRPAEVAFENGETLAAVRTRWRRFAHTLEPGGPVLVVTHDAVVRIAILEAAGRPLDDLWDVRVENAAYAAFDVVDGRWELRAENVNAHLADLRAPTDSQAL